MPSVGSDKISGTNACWDGSTETGGELVSASGTEERARWERDPGLHLSRAFRAHKCNFEFVGKTVDSSRCHCQFNVKLDS